MPVNITIVFPAYNEEENIRQVIEEAISVASNLGIAYDIIIVNDGSTDATVKQVEIISATNRQVHLVHNPHNMGYGATVRHGLYEALNLPNEWIFFTDSDRQFHLDELSRLFEAQELTGSDMVIGYRIARADPFHRKLFAKGWTTLSKIVLGFSARDVDCAFKLIRRTVLESMTLTGEGATLNPELLAKANRLGFRSTEVGVSHFGRRFGTQSGSNIRVILKSFRSLAIVWWEMRTTQPARSSPALMQEARGREIP